mmetsp:Transcript_168045/g.539592  ORF Transcript_168045/g.539592 Transcript_168045/m.539592 type:complete len:220 (+) Transcript_168045:803-1462(+)
MVPSLWTYTPGKFFNKRSPCSALREAANLPWYMIEYNPSNFGPCHARCHSALPSKAISPGLFSGRALASKAAQGMRNQPSGFTSGEPSSDVRGRPSRPSLKNKKFKNFCISTLASSTSLGKYQLDFFPQPKVLASFQSCGVPQAASASKGGISNRDGRFSKNSCRRSSSFFHKSSPCFSSFTGTVSCSSPFCFSSTFSSSFTAILFFVFFTCSACCNAC